jgi:hypothetical protein
MPEAKGKKSTATPNTRTKAKQTSASAIGSTGIQSTVTGPARLYGDDVPPPPEQLVAPPSAGGVKRGARPSPKPTAKPAASAGGEADVKPREHVAKGNKTPAVRTTKPKA